MLGMPSDLHSGQMSHICDISPLRVKCSTVIERIIIWNHKNNIIKFINYESMFLIKLNKLNATSLLSLFDSVQPPLYLSFLF